MEAAGAFEEVADGVRSSAEGDLRTLVKRERLPEPMYNPRLYAGDALPTQLRQQVVVEHARRVYDAA